MRSLRLIPAAVVASTGALTAAVAPVTPASGLLTWPDDPAYVVAGAAAGRQDWSGRSGEGCPDGQRHGSAGPLYGGLPGEPLGDPTPRVALTRIEGLLRRGLGQPSGVAALTAARRIQGNAGRAEVLLLDREGRAVAWGAADQAPDNSWTIGGMWSCSTISSR